MIEITLTQGMVAVIDDEDFDRVLPYRWKAQRIKTYLYARTDVRVGDRKYKAIYMHRLIMDAPPTVKVDHWDHDTLNNRKMNLRLATTQENAFNQVSNSSKYSPYCGVTNGNMGRKFRAGIKKDGKQTLLGYFENDIDAALAYDQAAVEMFGEFAHLNFPKGDPRL